MDLSTIGLTHKLPRRIKGVPLIVSRGAIAAQDILSARPALLLELRNATAAFDERNIHGNEYDDDE